MTFAEGGREPIRETASGDPCEQIPTAFRAALAARGGARTYLRRARGTETAGRARHALFDAVRPTAPMITVPGITGPRPVVVAGAYRGAAR
ncbi:hypothetical protein G3I34_24345 [Streptomyces sp. SID8014]|uniref:hypothetical protein n=1 Tax=Streptomyces sp. SID8014 TaxID=2706097 RepID=UPI0013BCA800|nr:hypothetical protein [Streptomyces sp. SID8014]NEC15340.1 hypothetical protein [Streptomyces sp. SID8014]